MWGRKSERSLSPKDMVPIMRRNWRGRKVRRAVRGCGAKSATTSSSSLHYSDRRRVSGGTGGTGSLSDHTGGHIRSHSKTSLCRRFAMCFMIRTT